MLFYPFSNKLVFLFLGNITNLPCCHASSSVMLNRNEITQAHKQKSKEMPWYNLFNKESRQEDKVSLVLEVFLKELMRPKILSVELEPHVDCHHLSYSNGSESGLTNHCHLVLT